MQVFIKPLERWRQVAGLRGAFEWKTSFPEADRSEFRFLSSDAVLSRKGQTWAAVPAMTLQDDQRKTSPY